MTVPLSRPPAGGGHRRNSVLDPRVHRLPGSTAAGDLGEESPMTPAHDLLGVQVAAEALVEDDIADEFGLGVSLLVGRK